jgi:hypothetical protein
MEKAIKKTQENQSKRWM